MPMMNKLSAESSPYLLQHKDNPVHWMTWGEEAWTLAATENKPVLISIGYSSCHWCHVMEHEVFEDFECAELMNMHFVCIKVDREERPDIDSIYMDAVHLMGSKGGWPLNVFTLPDGRPIYGGTYFPKAHWINVLENIHDLFTNDYNKVAEYASRLHSGIAQLGIIADQQHDLEFEPEFLSKVIEHWSQFWDLEKGGARRAPKFPMPNNIDLLLHYGTLKNDKLAISHALNTLEKMAMGGIFDQCGGGFSRYSVDDSWKVPHFEKMLYDNAQLISTFAKAFRLNKNPLFAEVIESSVCWLLREMRATHGLFYSALDADSEGEEGKFYTWTEAEVMSMFQNDAELIKDYYNVGGVGYWEHGRNILLRVQTDEMIAAKFNMSIHDLKAKINSANQKLLFERSKRIRPGLDTKCITSWNAMLISAFCESYKALGDEEYIKLAVDTFESLRVAVLRNDGLLWHQITDNKPAIDAYLDDYAFFVTASIDMYEVTFDQTYLRLAQELISTTRKLFYNEENGLFYFTTKQNEWLTRRHDVQDNVIPSSNSVLGNAMLRLFHFTGEGDLQSTAIRMLRNVLPQIEVASGYSNWLQLFAAVSFPHFEIVVTGKNIQEEVSAFMRQYLPQTSLAASTSESELPIFKDRFHDQTTIYVCSGRSCFPPVNNVQQAMLYFHEDKKDN
jgi:uncharacterized protein